VGYAKKEIPPRSSFVFTLPFSVEQIIEKQSSKKPIAVCFVILLKKEKKRKE
jgi:hypothetical protein